MCRKFTAANYLINDSARGMKLLFNTVLKKKVRKPLVLLLSVILISVLWYIEKTRWSPQYGMVFYEMGLRCDDECGQDRQLQYFQKAVRYNPKINDAYHNSRYSDAHYLSALIYEKKEDHDKALDSFTKAVEFDQRNALAFYKIGLYYFKKGAYELALRSFLKSHRQRGYPKDTHYYLAWIYDHKEEYDMAIFHYHEVRAKDEVKINRRLAELYYLLDRESVIKGKIRDLRAWRKFDLADLLEQNFKVVQTSGISGKGRWVPPSPYIGK